MHLRAALRNGLSPDQIKEVLLQVAVYAGVPAANRAFAIAARVLAEAGEAGAGALDLSLAPRARVSPLGRLRRPGPSTGTPSSDARVSVSRTLVLIAAK